MEIYTETGVFKRYKRNRTDKDGKTKEVTQVGVSGLSVNSQFDDDDEIIILSKEDFTRLENQLSTQLETITKLENTVHTKDNKILELENQLNTSKDSTPDTVKYTTKLINLQDEINNRNQLLFNTQNTITSILNEAVSNYNSLNTEVITSTENTKTQLITLLAELQNDISNILDYAKTVTDDGKKNNDKIDGTKWYKLIRNTNQLKIVIDFDKLTELEAKLTRFTSKTVTEIANELVKPVEIPVSNLDSLITDLDLNELYISTGNDSSSTEVIIDTDKQ